MNALPVERNTKEFSELRDRAAYVYTTGWYPTHLHDQTRDLLASVVRFTRKPTAMDGKGGSMGVTKTNARALKLDKHPMVAKVRELVDQGYAIQARRGPKARRPYGKVFLYKVSDAGTQHVTVQRDGSVLDRW